MQTLPIAFGKTPIQRIVFVYGLMFQEAYGFVPMVQWGQIGKLYKPLLEVMDEWQVAALILMHFDWHGASGEDDFIFRRLGERCFPMEWVPKAANEYRAFITNTLKVAFDDHEAIMKHVKRIIGPIYKQLHGATTDTVSG